MIPRLRRRDFLRAAGAASLGAPGILRGAARPPNIVVIFLDDSGYSDFAPFGKPGYPTPNVQRLASQGCTFTNFHVPQAVCSASRSALLSGCYPGRTGVSGALRPGACGLDPKFATLGEVMKGASYRTAVFGKWHIGDQPDTRPAARGFDESCGLMYSNNQGEPDPADSAGRRTLPPRYWENGAVKIDRLTPDLQSNLTRWYTERAVDFIRRNRSNPFLLYVPNAMPHIPLHCSERFRGKSGAGLYGDVIMEIDWSVGEIAKSLRSAGVEDRTLVLFTSDNGPWLIFGDHAGKTPFRESKMTGFDGGTRSACIVRYPGRIQAGSVSARMFCSVDLLPTFANLAGAARPRNPIDGKDIWDFLRGKPGAANPQEFYPFSTGRVFEGVFSGDGRWKLHLPHNYQTVVEAGRDGRRGRTRTARIELSLFDMEKDPLETTNVIGEHPGVAARLQAYAEKHRLEFYA